MQIFWLRYEYIMQQLFLHTTECLLFLLTVPNEVKLLKKEYFNRWYGLTSFYLAFTFSKLPGMVSKYSITSENKARNRKRKRKLLPKILRDLQRKGTYGSLNETFQRSQMSFSIKRE